MSQQILTTKLFVARPQANLVARDHLLRKLDEIPHRKLTLVSASAGFGKTTAITTWIHAHDFPVAWFSLDGSDNDPARFITYLVAALRTVDPAIGADVAAALESPQAPALDQLMPSLINDLAAFDRGLLLVLDDYHAIENETIHEALLFMLERAPASFHVVITTRVDPPIPLGRLRVRGELLEIRAADLRFSHDEALTFLNDRMSLALSEQHLAALQAKTEGWVAGLQLAALSLQGRVDVEEFITAFTGADRYVLDYLLEEVLALLPPNLQRMMLELSVLERFNGELGDAVTGTEGGAELLIELERRNLFLISLDNRREWFRYHHLFGDLLLHRLRQQYPDSIVDLHRRASAWYADQEMPDQAIMHANESGDRQLLADTVERFWRESLNASTRIELPELMGYLPQDVIDRSVRLQLLHAWSSVFEFDHAEAARRLDTVADVLEGAADDPEHREMMGHVWCLRAVVMRDTTDTERAVAYGERAIELLPDYPTKSPKYIWNASHSMMYLVVGSALSLNGHTRRSLAMFEQVLGHVRDRNDVYTQSIALSNLCREYALVGSLSAAHEKANELALLIASYKLSLTDVVAVPHQVTARVHCERFEMEEARATLAAALSLSSTKSPGQWSELHRILFQIEVAAGDLDAAERAIAAIDQLEPEVLYGRLAVLADLLRADLALRRGNDDAVREWAQNILAERTADDRVERTFILTALEELVLARALHRTGRTEEAIAGLDTLQGDLESRLQVPGVIEALLIRADIMNDIGAVDAAQGHVVEALTRGAAEGFIAPFVRAGDGIARLVAAIQRKGGAVAARVPADYLQRVAAACGLPAGPVAAPPVAARASADTAALTSREQEILHLMALGYSNQKIADKLYVSINTIKTHIANLFDKLGVRSRVEALLRAREEKMLG